MTNSLIDLTLNGIDGIYKRYNEIFKAKLTDKLVNTECNKILSY